MVVLATAVSSVTSMFRAGRLWLALALVMACFCFPAFADGASPDSIDACSSSGGFDQYALTAKIIFCVKGTIKDAVDTMLSSISDYMASTVVLIFVLSATFHGAKVLMGEGEITPKTVGLLLRIGIVLYFSKNLGGFADNVFDTMDWLVDLAVGQDFNPWQVIDKFLGKFLGFSADRALYQGILGIVGAALFSGSLGVSLFVGAMSAILNLMFFVLDLVYAYLTCVMVVGFLLILSPFFIPLAIFNYSERYFTKWLKALIGSILTPVLLFGFLFSTLDQFNTLISNTLNILDPSGNADFSAYWRTSQPQFSMTMQTDPNFMNMVKKQLQTIQGTVLNNAPIQNTINPNMQSAYNPNPANLPAIVLGANSKLTFQELLFSFISLWLYAGLMKGMVRKMPEVASAIADALTGIVISDRSAKSRLAEIKDNIKVGAGGVIGGAIGEKVGQGIGTSGARNISSQTGALIGGLVGRRL